MVSNEIGLPTLCKHSLMLNVKKCIRDKMALAADKNLLTKGNYSLMINKIRSAQMLRSTIQRIFGLCTIVLRIRDECAAVTRQRMFAITKKECILICSSLQTNHTAMPGVQQLIEC